MEFIVIALISLVMFSMIGYTIYIVIRLIYHFIFKGHIRELSPPNKSSINLLIRHLTKYIR